MNGSISRVAPSPTEPSGIFVSFDFSDDAWRNTGTVVEGAGGELMLTGTVSAQVEFPGTIGVITITGRWDAELAP